MSEIISIHVGKCGNRLGHDFWAMLKAEHGLGSVSAEDPRAEHRAVFFANATGDGSGAVARAVFVDLKPEARPAATASILKPENFVFGEYGLDEPNFAQGYYREGDKLIEQILQAIKHQVEQCSQLQGFILTHALGGGVGSGLGSLIIARLRALYPDQVIATFSVLPDPKEDNIHVLEPYNVVLALHQLSQYADLVFCVDNQALFEIYRRERLNPTHQDYNHLIIHAMSNVTAPLRFAPQEYRAMTIRDGYMDGTTGEKHTFTSIAPLTLHDLVKKLTPAGSEAAGKSPLHFLTPTLNPITARDTKPPASYDLRATSPDRIALALVAPWSATLAHLVIIREQMTPEKLSDIQGILPSRLATTWSLDATQIDLMPILIPAQGYAASFTLIANTAGITEMLQRVADSFNIVFRRKAFLTRYTGDGMEEADFTQAEANLAALITAYQDIQTAMEEAEEEAEAYEEEEEEEEEA